MACASRFPLTTILLFIGATMASPIASFSAEPATQPDVPALDAAYVRMEVPDKVRAGQVFAVTITMKNTGRDQWGDGMKLLSQDPVGNETWGTSFIIMGQGKNAKPGEEFTFASGLKAPPEPGKYAFRWRVARNRDGVMFGQPTERKVITVEPAPPLPAPKPPVQDPAGKHVLTFADFEYAGSFKVPRRVEKQDSTYSASGLALRTMPDGGKRLFMNYRGVVFEADVPPLVRLVDGDHGPLRTAEVKRIWGRLTVGEDRKTAISANSGHHWDESRKLLYWSSYHGYYTGHSRPVLAASKIDETGRVTHLGPWSVPDAIGHFKGYWGGVTKLSADFAKKHTGGRTLALGFGGYYSICATTSQGPALAAIARPDPAKPVLDMVDLLAVPWGRHEPAPRDGNYLLVRENWGGRHPVNARQGTWTMKDVVRAGIFIDLPDKHGYIAFALLATGRIGYDYGHITSAGSADWWYFYDPADLGKVATGLAKPWDVRPHSMTKVRYPSAAGGKPAPKGGAAVSGACFDEQARLLYLYKRSCIDNRFPCVHVYRAK
jgi:hypothetical protein